MSTFEFIVGMLMIIAIIGGFIKYEFFPDGEVCWECQQYTEFEDLACSERSSFDYFPAPSMCHKCYEKLMKELEDDRRDKN